MKTAFDPFIDEIIDVPEFFKRYGTKHDPKWETTERPRARCTACQRPTRFNDENRPAFDQGFAHMPDKNAFCPFKKGSDANYLSLNDVHKDSQHGQVLRQAFMSHWQWHFKLMNHYVSGFDIYDFIHRVRLADTQKLWDCSNLQEWELPYVMLVWQPFKPILATTQRTGKPIRQQWVRFWYDARVRTIQDLWIRVEQPLTLVRATYSTSERAKSPNVEDIDQTKVMTIDTHFLENRFLELKPTIDAYKTTQFERAFKL
jgi:hypothetical protein